jgi:dihydrofolate reductase
MISAIVAVDNDWGIGFNGDLLEHIPADLKYFKTLTSGNTVVMGRKTWDSLPKKPLPNRYNYIITHNFPEGIAINVIDNLSVCMTMEYLKDNILTQNDRETFIIGGGQIYKELLPLCDRVYVTKINKSHENIDTYFPNLDELDEWTLGESSEVYEYKDFTYQFCQYNRL